MGRTLGSAIAHLTWPFGLLVLLSSCIAAYTDFPAQALQARREAQKNETLFYRVVPFPLSELAPPALPSYFYLLNHHRADLYVVEALEANPVFVNVDRRTAPPLKGRFCLVRMYVVPESAAWPRLVQGDAYTTLPAYLWPAYSGDGGYMLTYSLYVDQDLKKVYRYDITVKAAQWVGLLPFAWINFFTYRAEEAFKATVLEFFHEAERDGYF